MKQIILSIAVTFIVGASAAFANGELVDNAKAQEVFKKEFPRVEHVKWSWEGDYAKASFILGNNGVVAFFDRDGELVGSAGNLFYNQLPTAVISSKKIR